MRAVLRHSALLAGCFLLTACLEIPTEEVIYSQVGEQLVDRCTHVPARQGFPDGLPADFTVLVWNLHKLQDPNWQNELTRWGKTSDLLMLQEAQDDPGLAAWLAGGQFKWQQVAAFRFQERASGVLNGSTVEQVYSCSLRIPEPATRLPKSSLLSLYPLQGSRYPLMVINVHAINFELGMAAYKQQVTQVAKLTRKYQGPVIVAGDFNTWGDKRRVLLQNTMARYQLQEASYQPDERTRVAGLPLDHLFYRGLTLSQAEAVSSHGSDHNPLRLGFHYP